MTATTLTPTDLAPFATIDEAKALQMIADALGMAKLLAPCIFEDEFEHADAARAVLRGAVLRWNDAGSGANKQLVAGPYQQTVDTSQPRRTAGFWPSEIRQLQSMCASSSGAFAVDTLECAGALHDVACALTFGAAYCSCGADLAGEPLWGVE